MPGVLVFFAFNSDPNVSLVGPIATGANGQAVLRFAPPGLPSVAGLAKTDAIQ